MLQTRSRKILRDVRSRKSRTLAAAASIFIGVLGVVILVSTADLLTRQLREDIQIADLPMMYLFVALSGDVQTDNQAYLEALSKVDGVEQVEARTVNPVSWKPAGTDDFARGFVLAAFEPFDQIAIQPMRLVGDGRYPESGQQEITIEKRMADRFDLQVGDTLTLQVFGDTDGDDIREEDWTITGIVFQPYPSVNIGTGSGAGFIPASLSIFATFEDAQIITGTPGFSNFFLRYDNFQTAQQQRQATLDQLAEATPYVPVFSLLDDPENSLIIRTVSQVTTVLIALAVLAMVVSGFLVTNIINTIMLEQKSQIGVMKSLGASRLDNLRIYLGVSLLYGVLGMIPGVLLGIPLGYLMATSVAERANSLIETFTISPIGVLLGVMMGLLIPLTVTILPILNGTRVSILEAMTDLGIYTNYGTGPLARLIAALPLPETARQAIGNVTRKKGRLALTIVTMTLAIAAFMGVFSILYATDRFIQDTFSSYSYHIQFTPGETLDRGRIQGAVEDVPEIEAVYPGINVEARYEEYESPDTGAKTLFTRGFDVTADAFALDLVAGEGWQENPERDGIVLSTLIAGQTQLGVGDTMTVTLGGQPRELEIIGIYDSTSRHVIMRWQQLAELSGSTAGAPIPNQYITHVEVEGYASTDTNNGSVPALGIEINDMVLRFLPTAEGLLNDPPGVVITRELAENGGYTVGDELTILSDEGEPVSFPIVDVVAREPLMFLVPEDIELPQDGIGFQWQTLAALEGRSLEGDPIPNQFYFEMTADSPSIDAVDRTIQDLSLILYREGITGRFTNSVESAQQTVQLILTLGLIFGLTALVMAAVGAIGLVATLSMSVFERQKEIGVMRSIGAGSTVIAAQFLTEGLLIGLISWLFAIPLSIALNAALESTVSLIGLNDLSYPPVTIMVGLIGTIFIGTVASLWPALSASRKTVSEIIRYQ